MFIGICLCNIFCHFRDRTEIDLNWFFHNFYDLEELDIFER